MLQSNSGLYHQLFCASSDGGAPEAARRPSDVSDVSDGLATGER